MSLKIIYVSTICISLQNLYNLFNTLYDSIYAISLNKCTFYEFKVFLWYLYYINENQLQLSKDC